MNLKKNLLALSVGAVIAAASTAANANSLLFPYFTTAATAQSALSLSTNSSLVAAQKNIHYVYNYGAACTHFDAYGTMTPSDLLQQSIGQPGLTNGFGLATGSDTSKPVYFPLANTTGFLVVSANNDTTVGANAISGDMAIVDSASGLVYSYAGLSNNADTPGVSPTNVPTNEGNFTTAGSAAAGYSNFNLSFYSTNLVQTSWFTIITGDMHNSIANGRNWTGTATISNNGNVFDNDENPKSGTKTTTITCQGNLAPTDLMTDAQQAVTGANGGLFNAKWTPDASGTKAANGVTPVDTAAGALMFKMQTVPSALGAKVQFVHQEMGTTVIQ